MNIKNIYIIGAGRMGFRHLKAFINQPVSITIIDNNDNSLDAFKQEVLKLNFTNKIDYINNFNLCTVVNVNETAIIISTTANQRLPIYEYFVSLGIKYFLIEKPLEQSRESFYEMLNLTTKHSVNAFCNHYRRTISYYDFLKKINLPIDMIVHSGAMGIAMNGIHWIDFLIYISNSDSGSLVFSKLSPVKIASGRGNQFYDFGGQAFFTFKNGSTLFLSCNPESSAPTITSIIQGHKHIVIDQEFNEVSNYERRIDSSRPNYQYGMDYSKNIMTNVENIDLSSITKQWFEAINTSSNCNLPTILEAKLGHDLLFDLLETSGDKHFSIA